MRAIVKVHSVIRQENGIYEARKNHRGYDGEYDDNETLGEK